jgi:hypothetical protein
LLDSSGWHFDGLDLAGPGVAPINHWRPGPALSAQPEAPLPAYAALARKPAQARRRAAG